LGETPPSPHPGELGYNLSMKNVKEILSEVISTKPDVLQFAKDRKYEEAWIINLHELPPSQKEIVEYVNKEKFETLIVEYIWNSKDDDNRFVLTLFLDKKCQLQDLKKFIDISLGLFYNYRNFESFINTIDTQIVGREYLLNGPVDSVNMSVFNYWLSVGPVELWKVGDVYDSTAVTNKIKARPNIEKTKLNYQGLLFRFNINGNLNGPYYGIKTPCCTKIGNDWIVDYDKVDFWIKLMLGL
jgi:hypothetical protein